MKRRIHVDDPLEGATPYPRPAETYPVNPLRIPCSDPPIEHESPWIGNPSAMTRQKWNNDGRFPVLPDNRGDD